jgi:hypothetical protein
LENLEFQAWKFETSTMGYPLEAFEPVAAALHLDLAGFVMDVPGMAPVSVEVDFEEFAHTILQVCRVAAMKTEALLQRRRRRVTLVPLNQNQSAQDFCHQCTLCKS